MKASRHQQLRIFPAIKSDQRLPKINVDGIFVYRYTPNCDLCIPHWKKAFPKMTKAQAKLELETLKEFYRKHKFNMQFDHDDHAAKVTELEEFIKGKVKPKMQTIEFMERDNKPTSKYDLSCMTEPDQTSGIPLFSSFAVPYDQAGSLKSAASYYKRKTPEWEYATQIRTENGKSVCRIWRLK